MLRSRNLKWYNVEMREVLESQRPSEWIEPDHNEKLPYATMAEWRAGDHGEPNWSRLDMLLSDYVYELMWDECRGSDTPFGKSPDRKELRRRVQEAREQAAQKIAAAKGKPFDLAELEKSSRQGCRNG